MLENLYSQTFVALFRHLRHARNDLCEPDCHFNKISLAGTNTYANSPSTATANSPSCGWQHPNAECERIIQANDELFAVFWFENQNKYSIKSLNTFGKFPGWASMTAGGSGLGYGKLGMKIATDIYPRLTTNATASSNRGREWTKRVSEWDGLLPSERSNGNNRVSSSVR